MNRKCRYLYLIITGCLLLSGCTSGKFTEEALKTDEKNQIINEEKEKNEQFEEKEQREFYKELEKPLDEVVSDNELDSVNLMTSIETIERDKYENEEEFAKFVASILYQFYTLQITPDIYYNFLIKYASEDVLAELPTKEDTINILTSLQEMYKKQNIYGDGYQLTEVMLNRLKREGQFYRKVLTTNGEEYYITSIIKEGNSWKYLDDGPSPPFIEEINKEGNTEIITY